MRRYKWFLFMISIFLSASWGIEVKAVQESENRKEIVSEAYEKKEEIALPTEDYVDEAGKEYRLESWTLEEEAIPGEVRTVKKEISYQQVEQLTKLPEQAEIDYKDTAHGYQILKLYPAQETKWSNEQWIPMELPLIFHTYGADFYEIGGMQIPYEESSPGLGGYEEVLLQEAELPTEAYRIEDVVWDGQAYEDEAGMRCRNALALGEKRVRDYQVTYGGVLQLPEKAVYRLRSIYLEKEVLAEVEKTIAVAAKEEKAAAPIELAIKEDGEPSSFSQIIKRILTITVGISALVFLGALLFLGWRKHKFRSFLKEYFWPR